MTPTRREGEGGDGSRADPLAKSLLFVTGKGGVGKSAVAAALGVLAARRGRRTIIAEVSQRDDVTRTLGAGRPTGAAGEVQLSEGLFWISIDPEQAMEEYLVDQLPVRALAELLVSSRVFTYLAAATPGLRELLTVGKAWELAQQRRRARGGEPFDLVIVDAPATGHGLAYLTAARSIAGAARVGPIARQGSIIDATLSDPSRTGVVVVTTAAETPINEALMLERELPLQVGLELDRVVVNGLVPARYTARELDALRAARSARERPDRRSSVQREAELQAIAAALSEQERAREQRRQLARLRRASASSRVTLPFLYSPTLGPDEIEGLADRLERSL